MGLTFLFGALILIFAVLLVTIVMIQNPKQGGLSSTFGGGQQAMGGVKRSTDILERATWILVASLIFISIIFNMMNVSNNNTQVQNDSSAATIIQKYVEDDKA